MRRNIESCRPLWDNLKDFGASIPVPWPVIGNFNIILFSADKFSGVAVKSSDNCDFVDCVSQLEISDLKYEGCFFTWANSLV